MRAVLGVGGGIAAYKAAELVRALQQRGHDVQVVMTRAAQEFIQPLTFAALTGRKVVTSLWAAPDSQDILSSAVEHIAVAQENDVLIVAPATADLLAKFAQGLADDFLTTLYLAFTGRVVLAPAMNTAMWEHPATQSNLDVLRGRGCSIVDPDEGWLACGTIGAGRLPDPVRIADRVDSLERRKRDFEGETLLITAGPTQESLDPVRYISNRSSGKMGYALAEAALRRGAKVILISGPTNLKPPAGAEFISVQTARDMHLAVLNQFERATVIIKAAAVADFTVRNSSQQKIKRDGAITLELEPTPDILAAVAAQKGSRIVVGFAAETQDVLENARKKMLAKGVDAMIVNDVSQPGIGFDSERNRVSILTRDGSEDVPEMSKWEAAHRVLDTIVKLRAARTIPA